MASILNKVAEHLCAICLEEYKDPKVLPCLHTYCYVCITKLKRTNDAIVCPECRHEVKIGNPPDYESFPSNFFIKNIQTTVSLTSDTLKKCENCDEGEFAEGRCQECGRYLCEFCIKCHKRLIDTKTHVIKTLDDLRGCNPCDVALIMHCPNVKHKNEIVKFFCVQCQETACRDCVILDHRNHEFVLVGDVVEETRKELEELVIGAKNEVGVVKKSLQEVQDTEKNLEIKADAEIGKIHQYFDCFRASEESMVNKVKEIQSLKVEKLQIQRKEFESKVLALQTSIKFTEDAFETGSTVQLLNMKKFIKESLSSAQKKEASVVPCVNDYIEFVADKTGNDIASEIFTLCSVRHKNIDDKFYKTLGFELKGADNMIVEQETEMEIINSMKSFSGDEPPVLELFFSGIKIEKAVSTKSLISNTKVRFTPMEVGTLLIQASVNGKRLPYQFARNVSWSWIGDRPEGNAYYGNLWASACFHAWTIELHDQTCRLRNSRSRFNVGVMDKSGNFQGLSSCEQLCTVTVELNMWRKTMNIKTSNRGFGSGSIFEYKITSDMVQPYIDVRGVNCRCKVHLVSQENASSIAVTKCTIDVSKPKTVIYAIPFGFPQIG